MPVTYQIALLAASPPFPSLLATCATKELFPAGQDSLVTRPPGVDDLRLAGRVLTPDLDVRLVNFCFSTCSWASLLTSQCFCVPVFEGGCVPHWTQARRPEGSDVFPPLLHCSPFFLRQGLSEPAVIDLMRLAAH